MPTSREGDIALVRNLDSDGRRLVGLLTESLGGQIEFLSEEELHGPREPISDTAVQTLRNRGITIHQHIDGITSRDDYLIRGHFGQYRDTQRADVDPRVPTRVFNLLVDRRKHTWNVGARTYVPNESERRSFPGLKTMLIDELPTTGKNTAVRPSFAALERRKLLELANVAIEVGSLLDQEPQIRKSIGSRLQANFAVGVIDYIRPLVRD